MERPLTLDQWRVRRVLTKVVREVETDAFIDGYYIQRRKDPYYNQLFIPTAIEGVGRRWGQKCWKKAAGGDKDAASRIKKYQVSVQRFYKLME